MSLIQKAVARLLWEAIYKPFGPIRPSRKTVMEGESRTQGMDLEAVYAAFQTETFSVENDGIVIPAEYHPVPDAKGIAILAHGYGKNRYVLTPQAKLFHDLGYSTIMFDQRHFGISKAPNSTFSVKEAGDLLALVRWARDRFGEQTRIVVLGVSMGAMTVMHAIGQSTDIDAAVEDCGPADMERIIEPLSQGLNLGGNPYLKEAASRVSRRYGVPMEKNRPVDDVVKSDTPLLIIHGEADSLVSVQHARDILAAARNPLSRMKLFPGREHAYSIQDYDLYGACLKEFLADVFGENTVPGQAKA